MNKNGYKGRITNQSRERMVRQAKIAELRLRGITDQRRIAAELDVSQATISRDFAEIDEQFKQRAAENIDAAKGLDIARLDTMIDAIWKEATTGKAKTWHIDRILKCMERRAALLGLDAPQRKEITGELMLRNFAERAAIGAGLDPAVVLAEAERILTEVE